LGTWLGFGGSTKVRFEGGHKARRPGKLLILISVIMIVGGLPGPVVMLQLKAGSIEHTRNALCITLTGYGILLLIIGKAVAWWQRP